MKALTLRLPIIFLALVLMPWTAFADAGGRMSTAGVSNGANLVPNLAAPASATARVNSFLHRLAKQHLFTGSVLVTDRSGVLLDKGYGFANAERHVPNNAETKFRLGDGTVQFTAMAILQLQDAGKLSLGDRACTYLASCPIAWKDVTIHELLNQTSGIPGLYGDGVAGFYDWKYWTPAQIIGLVKDTPLLFKPGTNWHYSQIGYIALGLIIERVSGQPYGAYLHDHLFEALGMTNSGVAQKGVSVPGLARGYDGESRVSTSLFDPSWTYAAAGVFSTVNDLYQWDQALGTEKLVSKQSLDSMFTPSFTFSKNAGYGYGSQIESFSTHRLIMDAGGMRGASTVNAIFPNDGVTIILLTNDDQTAMDVIFPYIADAVLGVKATPQTVS